VTAFQNHYSVKFMGLVYGDRQWRSSAFFRSAKGSTGSKELKFPDGVQGQSPYK